MGFTFDMVTGNFLGEESRTDCSPKSENVISHTEDQERLVHISECSTETEDGYAPSWIGSVDVERLINEME